MMKSGYMNMFSMMFTCLVGSNTPAAERPNILWLTSEDNSTSWIRCYGNSNAVTPNIDRLAEDGFQYMNAYANAPVCAPSRSTWITGVYALSMGTHPMRSRNNIPHDQIKYYPDYLRASGYYCANFTKTDYNIGGRPDKECWHTCWPKVRRGTETPVLPEWDVLKKRQPFFQVVNFFASHESMAFGDVNRTARDPAHDPADTRLRAYHPDVLDIRKNYAKYHDCVQVLDEQIGNVLAELEESGLASNTIVVYCSDHGGVMPGSKRFLFSSGLHAPLIVRIPEKYRSLWPADHPGSTVDRLVSFVDMPKTWLSLAGAEVPSVMQGRVFLGAGAEPEPEYHFAFRGRMDERYDNTRTVCDKRFLYKREYMPYVPVMQRINYIWNLKAAVAWEDAVRSGNANEVQSRYFYPKTWTEELYDMQNDPDNVHNLIDEPEYQATIARMRTALRNWQLQVFDSGLLPESERVKRAAEHSTTIYEMVRDAGLYNLSVLLDAADLALEKKPENLPSLRELLKNSDCGLRYWGIVGCLLLNDQQAGLECLNDSSDVVRAMAAWLLIRTGEKDKGYSCLRNLLRNNSYAMLRVLNIIDWMGDDGEALMPVVQSLKLNGMNKFIQRDLLVKFNLPSEEIPYNHIEKMNNF